MRLWKTALGLLVVIALVASGCTSAPAATEDTGGGTETRSADTISLLDRVPFENVTDGDASTHDSGAEAWRFVRRDHEPIHGWILLDSDPLALEESIAAAAGFGVNHIQLSHGLIMNVEDVLDGSQQAEQRVQTLSLGISLAHQHGMEAFIWAHEFSGTTLEICYDPADAVWESRADAYRKTFELLPDLDGVILMFGSAPAPPWFTLCGCQWCLDRYPGEFPLFAPPTEQRLRIVTEQIGRVVVDELHKKLLVRTFVHEPAEVAWHGEGLAGVSNLEFTGMHKGPVQDWQPYNPHHPNLGHIGNHPSVMELDLAGEYYGVSELPYCAPGYYWYRMQHLWANKGIGVVARVQRGSHHALGTPNQVNLLAVQRLVEDHDASLDSIWDEFLGGSYDVQPGQEGHAVLKRVLADTFPIRRKSHYVLGLWALEKGSDLPGGNKLDQFNDRGKMPKWDPDWEEMWNRVDEPDEEVLYWIWQEGTEAVVLAASGIESIPQLPEMATGKREDLVRRLQHQYFAARAWRAVDLVIFTVRAKQKGNGKPEFDSWLAWSKHELETVKAEMEAVGLGGVSVASPQRIGQFLASVSAVFPSDSTAAPPGAPLYSPLKVLETTSTTATLEFSADASLEVILDYGLEIPDYGMAAPPVVLAPGEPVQIKLTGLEPGRRYVVRARAQAAGMELRGGDFWLFTPTL